MRLFLRQVKALVKLSLLELWRRNDIVALVVLAIALLVPLSSAKPFGAAGATRYMDEVALLLIWAYSVFISLGAGARLFPGEFASRTIYPLLAKPVSRGALVLGKYLGAVVASWSALTFFYLLYALASGCRTGVWLPGELLQAFVLHAAFCALAVATALLGSLLLTNSANLTLSAGLLVSMFFFGRRLPEYADGLATPLAWLVKGAYVVAPHVEFFDLRQRVLHGWGGIEPLVLVAALAYGLCYSAALVALARWALGRKKL